MIRGNLDTSSWDRRVKRLSLCMLCLLATACATQPIPAHPPAPLEDQTGDTDYRLASVDDKLRQAERIEYTSGPVAAVLVVGTAQRMLPEAHEREHDYLEVIKAGMWAREGKSREPDKAAKILKEVARRAKPRQDGRLLADIELVRVLLALAEGDPLEAERAGHAALRHLNAVNAHVKASETAADLAYRLLAVDSAAARRFADRAMYTAARLKDDYTILNARLVLAHVALETGGDAEEHFLEAYEAAYRLNDMGWRNVVISQAVNAWYIREEYGLVEAWGDRLREHRMGSMGELPRVDESALWEGDYITLLSQYAFAVESGDPGAARAREAAALAVETIEELPEGEKEQWSELAEKLRSGLLQEPAEK